MWRLVKTLAGVHGMTLIDTMPDGQIYWRHKSLALLDNNFNPIWEREFTTLYCVKPFDEKHLLIQEENGGPVSLLLKTSGETTMQVNGMYFLTDSLVSAKGCLIRSGEGESKQVKLISHSGEVQDTLLPKNTILRFFYGSYLVSAYLTTITCFDVERGTQLWSVATTSLKYSADPKIDVPFFLSVIQDVLVTVFTTHVAAFNVTTGELLWEVPKGADHRCIVDNVNLFLLSGFKHLYALNVLSGQETQGTDLYVKNNKRNKSIQYLNLMEDRFKSNFVQDEHNLYFCLRSVQSIVTVNKRKLAVKEHFYMTTEAPGEMFNYDIMLLNNRLFVPYYFEKTQENAIQIYEQTV